MINYYTQELYHFIVKTVSDESVKYQKETLCNTENVFSKKELVSINTHCTC